MKSNQIPLALLTLVLLTSVVSATGVSAPYWDTQGNENPLYLSKGEIKEIQFELQNLVGEDAVTFTVSLTSDSEVAELTGETEYILSAGERKSVPLKVKVPSQASPGDKYKVRFIAQEQKLGSSGQFTLGSAFEKSFDVTVREAPAQAVPGTTQSAIGFVSSKTLIYLIIGGIILVIIAFWLKRRKK